MKILFCGDIMPGGVLPYQDSYIEPSLKKYLDGFDLRIGTLECAIGTGLSPATEKLSENGGNNNVCFARNEDFFRVKELGFDVVSLGNNHSFDLGQEGLANTIRLLDENKIGYFGAGMNNTEASKPFVIEKKGETICIIGCCILGIAPYSLVVSTGTSYGVYQPDINTLLEQIKSLRGKYNRIIVMPHWGEEHVFFPPYKCVLYAKMMIDAGADAVFGSHSHCISSSITYKRKPVYFGMGNFLYPDNCLFPPRPFYYPKSAVELKHLARCINYPKSVKYPTVCVWSEDSRIGMVVETDTAKEKMCVRKTLVRNGEDNIIRFYKQDAPIKNIIANCFLLPLAKILTFPFVYRFTHKFISKLAVLKMRHLGDFRKELI